MLCLLDKLRISEHVCPAHSGNSPKLPLIEDVPVFRAVYCPMQNKERNRTFHVS
jgi:hypothetical protein